ncbi:D-glycerate dehydrogenase [Sporolactobacillus shoreae]|uniref:D-glycerate dehydrogenase n=1 Tax=Sporolactobacillus shoreae TaxID=1465501 RepID=A0A4Z0GH63_9BACL|nr:D-glycerate dehydrogenase [Sporolactobacillus shoreae]TGA96041.1 D-glycerate dehydrogenase [Sporolactobacillus shoreae]
MKKPKVYIAMGVPKEVEEYISKYCEYEKWQADRDITRSELKRKLSDKDGVLLMGIKIDKDLLESAPNLSVVSNFTVGYNNFDIVEMKRRKIIGTNVPNVMNESVADLAFGLILAVSRKITELDKYVKNNKWKNSSDKNLFGSDVHGATLGIIGMGRIGEAVAKRAKLGFDMNVLYHNRNRRLDLEKTLRVEYSDFKDILQRSDFIVLLTPLTKETYHLIDFEEFKLMKNNAILVNVSRGQTINEVALVEALANNKILGAGLDVFEKEPISPDNELLNMPNVITLPHIGTATRKTQFEMAMVAAKNLVAGVYGLTPEHVVKELILKSL